MKKFTFTTKNNIFNNNSTNDYSKILDNIIADHLIKTNSYLSSYKPAATILKDNAFEAAAKFLANYNTKKSITLPFIIGKTYKLFDGTPIIFYDDEIQIGFDVFSYDDFANITFLNTLPIKTKKTIIDIYANGMHINIKI